MTTHHQAHNKHHHQEQPRPNPAYRAEAVNVQQQHQQQPQEAYYHANISRDPDLERLLFDDREEERLLSHYYYHYSRSWTLSLPAIALIVFAIYALAVSNTSEINKACGGDSLWKFVISSLFINFFQFFTFCIGMSIAMCIFGGSGGLSEIDKSMMVAGLGLFLIACALGGLVGAGFTITKAAMDLPECSAALSAVSFTHTPLLAIIAYVYVAIDCFLLVLVSFGGTFVFCCIGIDALRPYAST